MIPRHEPCYYLPWIGTRQIVSDIWVHTTATAIPEVLSVTWYDEHGASMESALVTAESDDPVVLSAARARTGYGMAVIRGPVTSDLLCVLTHSDGSLSMTHGRGEWLEHWPWWARVLLWLPWRSRVQYAAWPARTSLFILNVSNVGQVILVGLRPVWVSSFGAAIVPLRRERTRVRFCGRINWYVLTHGGDGHVGIQHVK